MSERRLVFRPDIGTGQLYVEHFSKTGEVTRPSIGTGQIYSEHFSRTREISGGSVASGVIYKEHLRFVDITTAPIPDVDTEVAFGIAFTDLGGGYITPLGGAFPTTGGVVGYVLETARSATSITLRASVSGVVARVVLFG
jgi:hypothetical protein